MQTLKAQVCLLYLKSKESKCGYGGVNKEERGQEDRSRVGSRSCRAFLDHSKRF